MENSKHIDCRCKSFMAVDDCELDLIDINNEAIFVSAMLGLNLGPHTCYVSMLTYRSLCYILRGHVWVFRLKIFFQE